MFEYRYAVVDSEMNVLRWDAFAHSASFTPRARASIDSSSEIQSEDKKPRDRVEVRDTWEFTTHPENVFRRKTFRDVVVPDDGASTSEHSVRGADDLSKDLTDIQISETGDDSDFSVFNAGECTAGDFVTGMTRVRLECRTLRPIQHMKLHCTGSCSSLGQWERDKAPAMTFEPETRTWRLDIDVASNEFPVRYKYYLRAVKSGGQSMLESGANRVIVPLGWSETEGASSGESGGIAEKNTETQRNSNDARDKPAPHSIPGFPTLVAPNPVVPGYDMSGYGNTTNERDVVFSFDDQPSAPDRKSTESSKHTNSPPSSPPASEPSPSNKWRGPGARPSRIVARDSHFRFPSPWRGCGIAVPVFSLRSQKSIGAGDFGDLEQLVDLAHLSGMNVVQILPVNDTTVHGMWWDSYPYSSVSVFALHPLYLRVQPLLEEAAVVAGPERKHVFDALRVELEKARHALDLKEVDYEASVKVKMSIARRCLKEKSVREAFLESNQFKTFLHEMEGWLKPYAVFSALRELFGTAEHWRWGVLSAENAFDTVQRLSSGLGPGSEQSCSGSIYDAVVLSYYVQFHLDSQLKSASDFASKKGVLLKGDLPIGVDKASVDTWMHPELFRMHASTGAPPDQFDPNGQNWGFPTYNWDIMAKDGYEWWRRRMRHLERYFSSMRVDHVLGFFRIWELPGHAKLGKMGRFRPSVPIRRHELDERGLWFVDRLCDPWITGTELRKIFGDRDGEAAGRFLEETGHVTNGTDGSQTVTYQFKPEYCTEQGLLDGDAFRIRDGSPDWLIKETQELRSGLLKLQHNVCLLRDGDDSDAFYPRIEMETTTSFGELEEWARDALSWLSSDYFNKRQDTLWRENARRTLPALTECTGQLVCGEDLGMVPPCVQPVLEDLGILGLRIQRMPHDGRCEFGVPSTYAYDTVCSPSCHDTITTRAWYEADETRRARFAAKALEMSGGVFPPPRAYREEHVEPGSSSTAFAPPQDGVHYSRHGDAQGSRRGSIDEARRPSEDGGSTPSKSFRYDNDVDFGSPIKEAPGLAPKKCDPRVMRAIIRQHMASPSALAIFPAQDLLALNEEYAQRPATEETINDPTNNRHYWRFRLHVRLEDLRNDSEWLSDIKQLVDEAGRNPRNFFAA
tara:strand:+ start:6638 stop:10045 length:3408 start_codon:yes stop_codon:yes gene_type:complete